MATSKTILTALDEQRLTPAQAVVLASSGVSLGYDHRRLLGEALLTSSDKVLIEHRVRHETHKWHTEADVTREIHGATRKAAEALVDFVSSGDDIRWLTQALTHVVELHIDIYEAVPGDTYESFGRTRMRTRRLNRSDLASLVSLQMKEQREDLDWCRENEKPTPMNWSPESTIPASHLACTTDQELNALQLRETSAIATRCLSELTPYRLWSMSQHCQEHVMDDLRDHLLSLCLGDGDEAGSVMAHTASKHFIAALDEWEKGE